MSDSDPAKTLSTDNATRAAKPIQESAAGLQHDQRTRWQKGERVVVEAYLEQYPELQDNAEAILELIYHEMLLREERGEKPQQDEYLRRFPQFAAQLKPAFEVHGALQSGLTQDYVQRDVKTIAASASDASLPDAADLPAIPGYEILGELGRGGMGVVYQARQVGLNRLVALKCIRDGALAGAEQRRRFLTEAETTATLQHPNIVRVHAVGELGGCPYFSMDFIEGVSLAERLADGPLPSRDAARYLVKIARAVRHAHEHNILHRDLKPSNILLDSEDEPHVTDFGLAKRLDQDTVRTQTGAVLGTPSYMAPEQAEGKKELTPAVDIYGLGALLYELLTGRPPFRAETPLDTMLQVLESQPAPPRLLNPKVGRDLETICLKCLEKLPQRRYPSAEVLAADLERYLAGEPVTARSANLLDRIALALERSQYDVQFAAWGTMLMSFAVVIGIGHLATTAVLIAKRDDEAVPLAAGIHLVMFVTLLVVFWRNRPEGVMPRTTAERQLWCVLGGFVASCTLIGLTDRLMSSPGRPHEPLRMYPSFAILSGLTFLVLGSSYWGACYLFAVGFWALALVLPVSQGLGPAGFGLMWTAVLLTIGLRLRRLGARSAARIGKGVRGRMSGSMTSTR